MQKVEMVKNWRRCGIYSREYFVGRKPLPINRLCTNFKEQWQWPVMEVSFQSWQISYYETVLRGIAQLTQNKEFILKKNWSRNLVSGSRIPAERTLLSSNIYSLKTQFALSWEHKSFFAKVKNFPTWLVMLGGGRNNTKLHSLTLSLFAGITVLLSLTVFQNIVTETLPQVSNTVPVLGTTINQLSNKNVTFYSPYPKSSEGVVSSTVHI